MATRPFQFSAFVLQKPLAKGSFLVNPLHRRLRDEQLPRHEAYVGFLGKKGTYAIAANEEHHGTPARGAQCSLIARA